VTTDPIPFPVPAVDPQDAPTEAMPNPNHPFPDDQVDEPRADTEANRQPTQSTVKVVRCQKCKAAIETAFVSSDNAQLCGRCFSLLVNQVGVPAAPAAIPVRLTFQLRAPPEVVREHERHLPDHIESAIRQAADDFGRELREAFFAGDAKLFGLLSQAKEHGLLLLFVVQAAMTKPAAPPAPADLRRKGKA
jgi:hypothetical protein